MGVEFRHRHVFTFITEANPTGACCACGTPFSLDNMDALCDIAGALVLAAYLKAEGR